MDHQLVKIVLVVNLPPIELLCSRVGPKKIAHGLERAPKGSDDHAGKLLLFATVSAPHYKR